MNPYYAVGFLSALFFWVWPGLVYGSLEVHWLLVVIVAAVIFLGAGRMASEYDMRFIAPRRGMGQKKALFAALCIAIVIFAALTRLTYQYFTTD
ncbi:MAG TPA: hypothetical protein VN878_01075 [Usitatibacter sp.]|nr:hypothetical protein [Usitatibacter sp.]